MVEHVLTSEVSGRIVEVTPGDRVIIELAENPTTGFRWQLDSAEGPVAAAGDDFVIDAGSAVGGGGVRRLAWVAVSPGEARIDLKHLRSWEGDGSVIERFGITLRIS